jgi:hypothetical protein
MPDGFAPAQDFVSNKRQQKLSPTLTHEGASGDSDHEQGHDDKREPAIVFLAKQSVVHLDLALGFPSQVARSLSTGNATQAHSA